MSTIGYLASFSLVIWSTSKNNRTTRQGEKSTIGRADDARSKASEKDGLLTEVGLPSLNDLSERNKESLRIARSLILGLPNPTSSLWSVVAVAINVLLALGVADMVYRAPVLYQSQSLSFARVGYVSDKTARLLIREPDPAQLPIYVSYRSVSEKNGSQIDGPWKSTEQIYWLSNDTDFTHSIKISNLKPSNRYQYALSNNHTGFFTTAMPVGHMNPRVGKFTFLASSCIKANFPYNPFAHPLSIRGFQHVAKWIPSLHASFMMFLGDFIYIDVPRRFGSDSESYRRQYRQVYASPDWPSVSDSLPWLHVLDDHDIANDWDANNTEPYPSAIDPFNLYHASVNPPPVHPSASYFTFTQGPASFFLLDTRSHRSPSSLPPTSPQKSMLGGLQLSALLAFLAHRDSPGVRWKFVISSVPFTRNWRFNAADTWAGYLHERNRILAAMWDVGARGDGVGVVIVSGDRHEFAATAFPPPRDGKWPPSAAVHEFSTSPLNMFYLPTRTYREVVGEDEVCINYVPDGNSKFGVFDLEQSGGDEQGLLRFRLVVDGQLGWEFVLLTPLKRAMDAVWG